MTIEFKEGRYFSHIWIVEGDGVDWLAALWRDPDAGHFNLQYRFRYYRDDKVFNSDDEKSWYQATVDRSEEDAIEMMDLIAREMQGKMGGRFERLALRTTETSEMVRVMRTSKALHFGKMELPS